MSRFDWPALMRAGIGGRGLTPAEFWALTPAELLLMLGQRGKTDAPMARARLEELARAYPDETRGDGDE
ncbi:rcc01693 family protein [Pelagovum pacificum]|uniref:Phage tail assembly chaperone n=1 Tax=Pelagovum pacificum TaxID=2588711 RepID=A0A5C5GEC1_9RHOB|nr:rcc01693 family protein [Pelagovum pacificum]QQA41236.1 phage tail assembly chaperone [Pelagovum pacificum]TNY31956.1 phage tail assembly chaperone [Pelagovum pacificum]